MTLHYSRSEITEDHLSTLLRNLDFHVLGTGELITRTTKTNEKPFQHYFRLNYILQGHIHLIHNGQDYIVPEGHMVFLMPEERTYIEENTEDVHLMFINFEIQNLDLRNEFLTFMDSISSAHMIKDYKTFMLDICHVIKDEDTRRRTGYGLAINLLLQHLFITMARHSVSILPEREILPHASSSGNLYKQAVSYIASHISETIRISELAQQLNISEIYLYKVFMANAGCSPKEYITQYRMLLARTYLADSRASIKIISDSIGYPDANYFSAVFKKENGISPAEFRKQKNSKRSS